LTGFLSLIPEHTTCSLARPWRAGACTTSRGIHEVVSMKRTRPMMARMFRVGCCLVLALAARAGSARGARRAGHHALPDKILDAYVRDGFVVTGAPEGAGGLDRYCVPDPARGLRPKPDQAAFWLNAYDAPCCGRSSTPIPSASRPSIRPRAFDNPRCVEQLKHRVGGQSTLDQIEKDIIVKSGMPGSLASAAAHRQRPPAERGLGTTPTTTGARRRRVRDARAA
jgi:hypothetical protein